MAQSLSNIVSEKINGKVTYTVNENAANLDSLVSILQAKTDAKLIFVTTTYVPGDEAGRFTASAVKYYDAAKATMKKHSVVVNDIYPQSILIHQQYGKRSNDVHYSVEGYAMLGKLVGDFLEKEIKF